MRRGGLRAAAGRLRREVAVIGAAARDPRTPRAARWVALATLAYAASPIDLIPDVIPVLGLLDDLLIVPLGLWLAWRLIPPEVLADHRGAPPQGGAGWLGAGFVLALWAAGAVAVWQAVA